MSITKTIKNSLNFNNIEVEYVHGFINDRALGRAVWNKYTGQPIKIQISIKHKSIKNLINTVCHELAHLEQAQYELKSDHGESHTKLTQEFIKIYKMAAKAA
jgi:hypothetical protein